MPLGGLVAFGRFQTSWCCPPLSAPSALLGSLPRSPAPRTNLQVCAVGWLCEEIEELWRCSWNQSESGEPPVLWTLRRLRGDRGAAGRVRTLRSFGGVCGIPESQGRPQSSGD